MAASAASDDSFSRPQLETDGDTPVVWYSTGVMFSELLDCKDYPPKLEMTVTGHTRRARDTSRPKLGRCVTIDGQEVVLFRFEGQVVATAPRCPHMAGKLEGGDIEDLASHGGPAKEQKRPSRGDSLGIGSDFDDGVDAVAAAPAKPRRLCVTCPIHGFQFDASTGVSIMPPGSFQLAVYRTRLVERPAGAEAHEHDTDGRVAIHGKESSGQEVQVGFTDIGVASEDIDF